MWLFQTAPQLKFLMSEEPYDFFEKKFRQYQYEMMENGSSHVFDGLVLG